MAPERQPGTRIGLVSDLHGRFDPLLPKVLAGVERILMVHDRNDRGLPRERHRHGPDVLVVGHSHRPVVEREGAVLVVNPGSAGPKRFSLPRTAGVLEISPHRAPRVRLWDLEKDRPFRAMG